VRRDVKQPLFFVLKLDGVLDAELVVLPERRGCKEQDERDGEEAEPVVLCAHDFSSVDQS
jgi:hypothetical protein